MGVYSLLVLHVDVCRRGDPAALRTVSLLLALVDPVVVPWSWPHDPR